MLSRRIVVCAANDAGLLVDARLTNDHIAATRDVAMETFALHPTADIGPRFAPHFDYLLCDEAAQATEPEIAMALTVMLPHAGYAASRRPTICLTGDVCQLGPTLASNAASASELGQSLLERLFSREVYARHPRARHYLRGRGDRLEPYAADNLELPFVNLVDKCARSRATCADATATAAIPSCCPCRRRSSTTTRSESAPARLSSTRRSLASPS